MKICLPLAVAGCLALTSCATSGTTGSSEPNSTTKPLPSHVTVLPYTLQTASVRARCFPGKLNAVLAHIHRQTGRKPVLTSGHRPNAKRSGSLHRKCLAADIRVPGVSDAKIIAAARTAPGIGGIGRYCNGIIHVDVGSKRQWSHCGGRKRRR